MSTSDLVGFELKDGTPIYIEVKNTAADTDLRRVSRDASNALKAQQRFEEAVGRIRPAAQVVLDSLGELDSPEEIGLEFGLKFSAEAGAIIASVDSEATFKVSVRWKRVPK